MRRSAVAVLVAQSVLSLRRYVASVGSELDLVISVAFCSILFVLKIESLELALSPCLDMGFTDALLIVR